MASDDITILMGGHGYPFTGYYDLTDAEEEILKKVPFHGGLDGVSEATCEYLPKNFKVHVLVDSNELYPEVYQPKDHGNVWVHSLPSISFASGSELGYLYTPQGMPVGKFIEGHFDSRLPTLKEIIPKILSESDGPVIAHMQDYFCGPMGEELMKMGVPLIFQAHLSAYRPQYSETFVKGRLDDVRLVFEREACERAYVVVAVSNALRNELLQAYKLAPEKVQVIPNGVDTKRFRPPTDEDIERNKAYFARLNIREPDKDFIHSRGRLDEAKGLDNVVMAFKKFSPNHPGCNLVITALGHPDSYKQLLNVRDSLPGDIRSRVTILNQRVNVVAFDQNCAVAVYPSIREACGLVALESGACERPVVVGDVGGFRETVIEEYTGTHVNPYSIDDIAEGIERAYQNREPWGKNARNHVRSKYQWEDRIRDYDKLYHKVLRLNEIYRE